MQRLWVAVWLTVAFFFPRTAVAQVPVGLSNLQVQFWPEYDQPAMLVIYDFQVAGDTQLPVSLSIRFPKDANLIAVASQAANGSLLNTDYVGPVMVEDLQAVTVEIKAYTTYRLEYYQPLPKTGNLRQFTYFWPGDYRVESFGLRVRVPVDATDMTTNPEMQVVPGLDGSRSLQKDLGELGAGKKIQLEIKYSRTSDALSASQQDLQPSQPLDANTPGRVMLSNYLPYIVGGLGVILIIGGSVYFWQSSRGTRPTRGARHHRGFNREGQEASSDIYCPQCGTRAHLGDRFCRVCGSKLRRQE